jgi:hypothetical protein
MPWREPQRTSTRWLIKNINLLADPVITQPLGDAAKQELWSITAISSAPGECDLTLSGTVDVHGWDTVWVYGIGQVLSLDSTGDVTMSSSTITNIGQRHVPLQHVRPGDELRTRLYEMGQQCSGLDH